MSTAVEPPVGSPSGERCVGLESDAEWDDPATLRGELLSPERLALHAIELARTEGPVSLSGDPERFRRRIVAARERITRTYDALAKDPRARRRPSPALEWLLDNSHIVGDQLREIEEDLPAGYRQKLPRLDEGRMRGYPRVYRLCLDYLRHTDARLDPETLADYVRSYQTEKRLAIGELWAIPILLRLGLVFTTGAISTSTVEALEARPERGREPKVDDDRRDESARRRAHVQQAADQVTIGNAITSMRTIAALDWRKFFERVSFVDSILREDPHGLYAATDDASRDRYRHAVEELAAGSRTEESDVATAAVRLSREAGVHGEELHRQHVGYYLVDDGRRTLEAALGFRPAAAERPGRFLALHPGLCYFGGLGAAFVATLAGFSWAARVFVSPTTSALLTALAALPLGELVMALVNTAIIASVEPRVLSKLSLEQGVPEALRTLVVIPCFVQSKEGIDELLEHLEIRALGNLEDNVFFALATDLCDAKTAELPEDERLVQHARRGIDALNRRHSCAGHPRFHLFHRRRVWNPSEGVYMGWERKRGKLEELNRLVLGTTETTHSFVSMDADLLHTIRYVITLDADTELPRDAARKLIATIAHPLNRALLDDHGRVIRGHGVVQPRVGITPDSTRLSRYARVMAGPPGIDPYTTAISDVYQDLFGSGSYVGKGIYEVRVFAQALSGRVPENRLLSHDLFEGVFARAALATDVEVLDDQPSTYAAVAARQHRWIRGDLQLVPWLLPTVPTRSGKRPSDVPWLGRYKLADNVRRAMVAPSTVALAAFGFFSGEHAAFLAALGLLATLTAPLLARVSVTALRSSGEGRPRLTPLGSELGTELERAFLGASFLLDQAVLSVDAIARTAFRMSISHRHLLEWQTASEAEKAFLGRLPARLWLETVAALATLALLVAVDPRAAVVGGPWLLLWAASPLVALASSKPPAPRGKRALSEDDRDLLRGLALRTWRFFETFVTEEDHFLPPDNFQQAPAGVVAHRTSPTNIGTYLLSVITARDLGFITLRETVERLDATLGTIEGLEKREGHVLNWYDTTTLRPLEPQYVSTVDSGNLAGYLWTLNQACAELLATPIADGRTFRATLDAVLLGAAAREATGTACREPLEERLRRLGDDAPRGLAAQLQALYETTDALESEHGVKASANAAAPTEEGFWFARAGVTLSQAAVELCELAPFASSLGPLDVAPDTELAESWDRFVRSATSATSITALSAVMQRAAPILDEVECALVAATLPEERRREIAAQLLRVRSELQASSVAAERVAETIAALGRRSLAIADAMNFRFLYDRDHLLFSIGYDARSGRLDGSHYDLLASEARLASLVAIARGEVPQKHWFRLGRPLVSTPTGPALYSWSGSMFEYLMPLLVVRNEDESLLSQTALAAVDAQRRYGERSEVPWGISESLFNLMDLSMTYQYRAFGVPGLGLKQGLDEDLVIAPYATALAALVRPDLAIQNLRALAREGCLGAYGFFEAIDFTPARRPAGRRGVVVEAFMAHHEGMTLVALGNVLTGDAMQRRFHADPRVKTVELLLSERVPSAPPAFALRPAAAPGADDVHLGGDATERIPLDLDARPHAQLLGQGDVSSIVTSLGGGVVTWRGLDVTRFREDATLPGGGVYVYVRNLKTRATWSAGFEPTCVRPDRYESAFSADRVEIRRRDGDFETVLEVAVSPESPAEVRRLTLVNHGDDDAELEVTTYSEIVLANRDADRAHPAFSNLFVETAATPSKGALLSHRRRRSDGDTAACVVQMLTPEEGKWSHFDYETSRAAFVGRGRSPATPIALERRDPLGKQVGHVLDPAFVLRRTVTLKSGHRATVSLVTAVGVERAVADRLIEQFSDAQVIRRAFELGRVDARVELRHLGIPTEEALTYQRLFSALVLPNPELRVGGAFELEGARGRGALYGLGLSGDLPILILRIDDPSFAELAEQLLRAHELFRLNGFPIDLVFLNEQAAGYFHPLEDEALDLIRASVARGSLDRPGGVRIRRSTEIAEPDRTVLLRCAHVVLSASRGPLAAQLRPNPNAWTLPPQRKFKGGRPKPAVAAPIETARRELVNGIGGFDPATNEYVMTIGGATRPNAPWSNVLANENVGFLVTESGASCTWTRNSQSHRLTPWSNDPVCDPSGEAIYLRDDESGEIWSATPAPAGGAASYVVRHGFGRSVFSHERGGLRHELTLFVDRERPVKISRLVLDNPGHTVRRLAVYGVVEWVLGGSRERHSLAVATEFERSVNGILANNPMSNHPTYTAFFRATSEVRSFTGNRAEFFGHGGNRRKPRALGRQRLSGMAGAGLDPIAALEVEIVVPAGGRAELSFVLGEAGSRREALALAAEFSDASRVAAAYGETRAHWQSVLGAVRVRTPDAAFDVLMNGWLLAQALSCRLLGRTAFYQSSGAYGFRDQLQDVLALLHAAPELARGHILRAAGRQFREGDVQHWWHPDTGEGIRTRCSDDMLWLPFAVATYVRITGDAGVLDEVVPFLEERAIPEGETEAFGRPSISTHAATLYEHCVRAISVGTTRGRHGLPKMRGGDWNDGMNRVGGPAADGGESVWLAWFVATVLRDFVPIASARGDSSRVDCWHAELRRLSAAVDESGWDGDWYRRGYFDDGAPLGTHTDSECRIDAIAQSWAVIAGIGSAERARRGLEASMRLLEDAGERTMALLAPPFDGTAHDPGYIRAYPPGIRENGGQYTHGVLWTVLAWTLLGEGDRAYELLSCLNPVQHGLPPRGSRYAVEPYVVAGDVCAGAHAGRGGWTWYTGAAGWWYRIGLEHVLGIQRSGEYLTLSPCVPVHFDSFEVTYRYGRTTFRIAFRHPGPDDPQPGLSVDGARMPGNRFRLVDDGREHDVTLSFTRRRPEAPESRPQAGGKSRSSFATEDGDRGPVAR
ncbi:MAG TPA: glucoamylase family protein [Polyangiaceae bacterium]|nr:glucoamylase family protein [Polyangiaceae bacterium]